MSQIEKDLSRMERPSCLKFKNSRYSSYRFDQSLALYPIFLVFHTIAVLLHTHKYTHIQKHTHFINHNTKASIKVAVFCYCWFDLLILPSFYQKFVSLFALYLQKYYCIIKNQHLRLTATIIMLCWLSINQLFA